jgi:hypothetical protein
VFLVSKKYKLHSRENQTFKGQKTTANVLTLLALPYQGKGLLLLLLCLDSL